MLLTLAVLLIVGSVQVSQGVVGPGAEAADRGVERLQGLIDAIPAATDRWVRRPVSMPDPAIRPLRKVDFGAWAYENIETGAQVTAVCIVARDRRDLAGYSPRRWHAAQGWQVDVSQDRTWHVGDRLIRTQVHELSGTPDGTAGHRTVLSFVILPDGRTHAWLDESLFPIVGSGTSGGWGVAMLQLTFPAHTPHRVMAQVMQALAGPMMNEIEGRLGES